MSDAGGLTIVFVAWSIMLLLFGSAAGSCSCNNRWKKDLIDRPGYIAAVRSGVLAKRAVEAAR